MPSELDPLYWQAVRWLVAAVFMAALAHKLVSLAAFETVMRDYRLLPANTAPAAARLVVLMEAEIGRAHV